MPALERAVAAGWGVRAVSVQYVPEGGGSHHWKFVDADGLAHFVTVDDLDAKEWLGDRREVVLDELTRALRTSRRLHDDAALDFVVAPKVSANGDVLERVTDRYTASVFPYLTGLVHPFGPYRDAALRQSAISMVAALHSTSAVVEHIAPRHVLTFNGQRDLGQFLDDPDVRWDSGPFAERVRHSFVEHVAELVALVGAFGRLGERTEASRARVVVTHGEPHPANLMTIEGHVVLLDWDTVALAPPERDLWLVVGEAADIHRYERATGRTVDNAVLVLYQLRWFLDDLASTVRLFRNLHIDSADTRRWIDGLEPRLAEVPVWLERLAADSI